MVPPAEPVRQRVNRILISVVVVVLFVGSSYLTDVRPGDLAYGIPTVVSFTLDLFPPDWSYWSQSIAPMLETIRIAVVATTLGSLLAVPAALLGARNMARSELAYRVARFVLAVVRTLPEVIVAVVFVAAVGLGPVAGTLALIIFTFGFVAKLFSESIEAIDPGPPEAVRAAGGNAVQVARYGVLPQVLPQLLSYSLYSFEVNVRIAVVLGIVGAGGIGQLMMQEFQYLQYQRLATILVVIFAAVVLIDLTSNFLRRRLV